MSPVHVHRLTFILQEMTQKLETELVKVDTILSKSFVAYRVAFVLSVNRVASRYVISMHPCVAATDAPWASVSTCTVRPGSINASLCLKSCVLSPRPINAVAQ